MPIDRCYVISLPSMMHVIPSCSYSGFTALVSFLIHHTSATSGTVYHNEDCHVHVSLVPLDHYIATDGRHKGLKTTYGGDQGRRVHSITYGPVGPVLKYIYCL